MPKKNLLYTKKVTKKNRSVSGTQCYETTKAEQPKLILEVPVKNLFGALTASMLVCSSLVASPVGNPSAPMSFEDGVFMAGNPDYSMRLGFSSDYVSDRRLQVNLADNKAHVDATVRSQTIDLAFNFFNKVDLFARYGMGAYGMKQNNITDNLEVRTKSDAHIWALGGRGILYNWDFTTLSAFGEFSQLKGDVTDVVVGAVASGHTTSKATLKDWNIGLALSHQIDYLAPYIGVKYSDARVTYSNPTISFASETSVDDHELRKLKSRSNVGAVVGCTFMAGKKFDFTIEGRMFDEAGMCLMGALRF